MLRPTPLCLAALVASGRARESSAAARLEAIADTSLIQSLQGSSASVAHGESCEDWIHFNQSLVRSNLGGQGPDYKEAQELRFRRVGTLGASGAAFDLTFQNQTSYYPQNSVLNRVSRDVARLNLHVGSFVKMEGTFVQEGTSSPVAPNLAKLTFCDVDHYMVGQEEQLILSGITALYVAAEGPEFSYRVASEDFTKTLPQVSSVLPTRVAGRTVRKITTEDGDSFGVSVTSTMFGQPCDDPVDSNELANVTCRGKPVDQAKRCFMAEFQGASNFSLLVRIPGKKRGKGSRDFVMSGTSRFFAADTSRVCEDPAAWLSDGARRPSAGRPARQHTGAGGGAVSASGDPHMVNMHGQRFDIARPGSHMLLQIPRWTPAKRALLRVDARVAQVGGACADMYFQSLNVTGRWVKGASALRYRVGEGGLPGSNGKTAWMRFGHVDLKVVNGHTNRGVEYLNFFAKHLHRSAFPVGGLLGEDDHTSAATPDAACRRAVDI